MRTTPLRPLDSDVRHPAEGRAGDTGSVRRTRARLRLLARRACL